MHCDEHFVCILVLTRVFYQAHKIQIFWIIQTPLFHSQSTTPLAPINIMKLITFVFATLWHFAHAQEELGSSTFLFGVGSGENNVNVELAIEEEDIETTTYVDTSSYGDDDGIDLHERELRNPFGAAIATLGLQLQGIFGGSDGGGAGSLKDYLVCNTNSQCKNGCCSNHYSNDGRLKCTPLNGGFNAAICNAGGSAGGIGLNGWPVAYVTILNFKESVCGFNTRWLPYVMATSNIDGRDSPNCGKCYLVSGPAGTRFITAITKSVPAAGGGMHFDIHPQAFREIMGEKLKSGRLKFLEVASSKCEGNRG